MSTTIDRMAHRIGLVELRDDETPQCSTHARMLAELRTSKARADHWREEALSLREALDQVKRFATERDEAIGDALSSLSSQLGHGIGGDNESPLSLAERVRLGVDELARIATAALSGCGDRPRGPGGGLRDTYAMERGECRRYWPDMKPTDSTG